MHTITIGGRALNLVPLAALLAQGVDHPVDIGVDNFNLRPLDLNIADVDLGNIGKHFQIGSKKKSPFSSSEGCGSMRVMPATRSLCSPIASCRRRKRLV